MEFDSIVTFTLFKMDKSVGKICIICISHTRKQVTFETIRSLFLKNKKKLRIKLRTIETESEKMLKKDHSAWDSKLLVIIKECIFGPKSLFSKGPVINYMKEVE